MIQDAATRAALEMLYRSLLSAIVVVARLLGKPCPLQTREERRQNHNSVIG